MAICGCFLMFVSNDIQKLFEKLYWTYLTVSVIFILVIPETPRWLFSQNPKSLEGIRALNYIAWINGSSERISSNAMLDVVGQVIQDNRALNERGFGDETSVIL